MLPRRQLRGIEPRWREPLTTNCGLRTNYSREKCRRTPGAAVHERTKKECRSLVLGHLQRGGMPTGYDRLLATRFGAAAVRAVEEEAWGQMVAVQSPHLVTVPINEVLKEEKRVSLRHDIVEAARATGISLGD